MTNNKRLSLEEIRRITQTAKNALPPLPTWLELESAKKLANETEKSAKEEKRKQDELEAETVILDLEQKMREAAENGHDSCEVPLLAEIRYEPWSYLLKRKYLIFGEERKREIDVKQLAREFPVHMLVYNYCLAQGFSPEFRGVGEYDWTPDMEGEPHTSLRGFALWVSW